jgi:hypothetical protein
MALRLQPVAAHQGLRWVRQGFALFARKPLAFTALLLAFFFCTLVLSVLVPLVGSLVSLMALPLLTMGFLLASRSALAGGPVHPGQLIEPLRAPKPQRNALLMLCALYGIVTVLVFFAADAIMGDALERLQGAIGSPASQEQLNAVLSDPRVQRGMLLEALLLSLIAVPFWHAPPLVLWGQQSVAQSLFSSTVALWRCRGAFALYAAVWFAVIFVLGTLTTLLLALFGLGQMAPAAALPIALMCMSVFYVSLYFIFVDSFAPAEETPQPQLPAGG